MTETVAFLVLLSLLFGHPSDCRAAAVPKVTAPKAKITVYRVGIGFQNSRMPTEKAISDPSFQRVGALTGDAIVFKAMLTPALTVASSKFTWSGEASGSGQTISVTFPAAGSRAETISVGKKNRTATIAVMDVPPPNQDSWSLSHPIAASEIYFSLAPQAESWAASANSTYGWGDAYLHNGKADAARHSYWNVLMVLDSLVGPALAAEAGTAHERTNLEEDANVPHNESVMDLENNSLGRAIGGGLAAGSSQADQQAAIVSAVGDGTLTILDDLNNTSQGGLLQPSNK